MTIFFRKKKQPGSIQINLPVVSDLPAPLIVKWLLGKYFWVFLYISLGTGVWIVFSGRVS